MNPETDADVLYSLWRGDRSAFEILYRRHSRTILRYAWAQLGDRSGAEEILQEVFLTMWVNHRRATTVDQSLLPWLLAITSNHLKNAYRKNRRRRTLSLTDLPETSNVDTTGLVVIEAALASLSQIDRRICELCLIEGHTYRSAAAQLELTEGSVRKRLQRARVALRTYLKAASETEG